MEKEMNKKTSNEDVMKIFESIEKINREDNSGKNKAHRLQNKIIEDLSFLVYNNAKRYRRFNNYDDLVQEGFVGLIKATKRFDYKRFPNFFVFANQWILNNIRRAAKKYDVVYNPNRIKTVYFEHSDGLGKSDADEQFNQEDSFIQKERMDGVRNVISSLPKRDQVIINKIFGINTYEHTLRETEKYCNITYERIRQIKDRIIKRLKYNVNLVDVYE